MTIKPSSGCSLFNFLDLERISEGLNAEVSSIKKLLFSISSTAFPIFSKSESVSSFA